MSIIALQVFVSLALVAGSIVLFVFSARQRDFEHADRLALAPLDNDVPDVDMHDARAQPGSAAQSPSREGLEPSEGSHFKGKEPCTRSASNTTTR